MRTLLFLVAYSCLAIPCAHSIAKSDPEPIEAGLVLYALALVSAIVFPIAYGLTAEWSNRTPQKIIAFVTGAVCALAFFGSLAFVHPSNNFALTLAIASFVGLAISVCAPGFAPDRVDKYQRP